MQVDNMGSSTTQHHISIPIAELSASLEAEKEEKPVTDDYVENIPKPEEKSEAKNQKTEEKGECRYCREEDFVSKLESPCNCTGSLKYVHRSCIDQWCNSKGCVILCEICRKPYNPDFPIEALLSDDDDRYHTEMSEEYWRIPGTNTQFRRPLVLLERGINSVIASMNKDFNWRKPTGGMMLGMSLLFVRLL
ncbi:E3 ubiquitin-protein ligase MARCH7-like [Cajanus cajan]|uniref:E3 ubiquitin-protein ligase MARCH7-like n=1 Tax=Cajanus cajan TaxID=3821 RepID=UPI0010FAF199|nr:E3 ubiquitin-protein ligase MARCH7-like [Cajanus cajan]